MKVEIGEVTYVDGPNIRIEFNMSDKAIPMGAKVAVEWDENIHRCKKMDSPLVNDGSKGAHRDEDGRWRLGPAWNIKYCPYCGVKLT